MSDVEGTSTTKNKPKNKPKNQQTKRCTGGLLRISLSTPRKNTGPEFDYNDKDLEIPTRRLP